MSQERDCQCPREQLQDLQPQIYPVLMSQETASYWQSPSSREKLSQKFPQFCRKRLNRAWTICDVIGSFSGRPRRMCCNRSVVTAGLPGMLSEFSGSPPSIRITEPATPIPVTGWTPFLVHGFLGPFDSGPSKAFQHRCRSE